MTVGFKPTGNGLPHSPQLSNRLVWQDVPSLSLTEEIQIWEFLRSILHKFCGIITFETAHRDWLQAHCPKNFPTLSGTVAEWAGQERTY